jgi:predicted flavoprotein YhiN
MYGQDDNNNNIDVVVIAGGLAGLNKAALVACAGKSVTLNNHRSKLEAVLLMTDLSNLY